MDLLRRRRVRRLLIVALAVAVAIVSIQLISSSADTYLPGENTAGLVDTLARGLPADLPALAFRDVTAEAGLAVPHFPATRTNRLPEDMGSGVAVGDVDGDGFPDLYLVGVAGPLEEAAAGWPGRDGGCRLFRNRGDGRFEDVTEASGAGLRLLGMGATFVDSDGDGDLDLFVTSHGRCHLLANDGTGRFRDVSEAAGVAAHSGFYTGVAAGDPDRDGDVDLYVTGYVRYREELGAAEEVSRQYGTDIPALINPSVFEPEPNLLLRNRGDGTFDEVAEESGVHDPRGRGLAAVFADLSGDGWPDLYVANDVSDNVLFVNGGDGSWHDLTTLALVGDYRGAMGLAVGDFDADLDPDLFITHWVAQENALYVNVTAELSEQGRSTPACMFVDEADRWGLGQVALRMVGWATGFIDLDADGWLDLFVANGSTIPLESDRTRLAPMPTHLFWNAGAGRGYFEVGEVASPAFAEKVVARGGVGFDHDLDGDVDLLLVRHGQGPQLLANEGARGHVLVLRLRQETGNTFCLGAVVDALAGGQRRRAWLGSEGGYLSQPPPGEVAFGLGRAEQVDELTVRWPDGTVEQAGPFPAEHLVTWVRGEPPRVEALPGRGAARGAASAVPPATGARPGLAPPSDGRPGDVATLKRFYAVRDAASTRRIEGDLLGAAQGYEEALALWPGHHDCLYYLGNCRLELGREQEARAAFEELVRLDPAFSKGWMQLGRLHLPGGDPDLDDLAAARAAFERAHAINAEESGPVIQLGVVALLEGDLEEADRWLADGAAHNSGSVEARWWRGWIAWQRGDGQAAQALLDAARAVAAGATGRGASPSAEGDTASGRAMLAGAAEGVASPLERWRTVLDRPADAASEYGALLLPGP